MSSTSMDDQGVVLVALRPFHVGCVLSIASSLFVLLTFLANRERRRHPASLIALRSLCDLVLAVIWLATSLDWEFTRNDCKNPTYELVAVMGEFLIIASESLIACVSFDLLINSGNAFADYVSNVVTYVLTCGLVSTVFATALFATRQENIGASFLPVCWIRYHGGRVLSDANVPMSLFFYIPWSAFFLLSVASIARACVFLSSIDSSKATNSSRAGALRDTRRVIFAHAAYYGLMLVFYAPLVNAMDETDDADSLQGHQAVLLGVVRFLSGARAIENLLVWFPKWASTKRTRGEADVSSIPNADLSPLLNFELQREVLLSCVVGMVLSLKARRTRGASLTDGDIEVVVELDGLNSLTTTVGMLDSSYDPESQLDRGEPILFRAPDAFETVDPGIAHHNCIQEPLLGSVRASDSTCSRLMRRLELWMSKEQSLLFFSVAPIQFACLTSGLSAILDKNEPSYLSVVFISAFVIILLVTMGSYRYATLLIEDYSRARVKEVEGQEFCHLRNSYGVQYDELISSLVECATKETKFTLSGGRSGAFMFFSPDKKFVVKTIPKREKSTLVNVILPHLREHLSTNCPEFTSLSKIFALFQLSVFGNEMYVVVLENVQLGSSDSTKYDLKGSFINRSSSRLQRNKLYICDACGKPFVFGSKQTSNCALSRHGHTPRRLLKDNEFRERILVDNAVVQKIRTQIQRDVKFLASLGIMDYSLLLCVKRRIIQLEGQSETRGWHPQARLVLSSVLEGASAFQFGIIDWFTEYDSKKKLERFVKTRLMCLSERDEQGFSGLSAVEPVAYCDRFMVRVVDAVFPMLSEIVQVIDERSALANGSTVVSTTLDVSEITSLSDLVRLISASLGASIDISKRDRLMFGSVALDSDDSFGTFKQAAKDTNLCTLKICRKGMTA